MSSGYDDSAANSLTSISIHWNFGGTSSTWRVHLLCGGRYSDFMLMGISIFFPGGFCRRMVLSIYLNLCWISGLSLTESTLVFIYCIRWSLFGCSIRPLSIRRGHVFLFLSSLRVNSWSCHWVSSRSWRLSVLVSLEFFNCCKDIPRPGLTHLRYQVLKN